MPVPQQTVHCFMKMQDGRRGVMFRLVKPPDPRTGTGMVLLSFLALKEPALSEILETTLVAALYMVDKSSWDDFLPSL